MHVHLDVWSDYVCPFCYLGEPVLDHVAHVYCDKVRIRWRAFELRPEPVPTLDPNGEYLREVWSRSVYPMAERAGMTLRLPPVQPRSRLAHQAVLYAGTVGHFGDLNDAIFKAFFEDGRDVGDAGVLVELGGTVGLDVGELRQVLESERFLGQVLADEARAQELGLSGVPASVISKLGQPLEEAPVLVGAQPFEAYQQVIDRLLAEADRQAGTLAEV